MSEPVTAAVLMACFNRRELTLRCLRSLFAEPVSGLEVDVVLVDDGSSDGTAEAVKAEFPSVNVVGGTGSLYWSASMALAWRVAAESDPDYYLLLNDDVEVVPGALSRLLATAESVPQPAITVGAIMDPETETTTYGGHRLISRWNPMAFKPVEPYTTESRRVDLFSGNFVLVPRSVYRMVGTIDPKYSHGIGDFDYARRAAARGVELQLAPGHYGRCALNPPMQHSLRSFFTSIKTHRHPRDWARYCWRHGHWWALPVSVPSPYVKAVVRWVTRRPIVTY